ncbi:universal stress protein [Mycobacteroides abscessus]|uniref:universal stress protein n=1 Tax=Mycobacteroides abscessus TaxID=36809 RepID=UPI0009A6CCA3|nr:universal stress protein [Mycobacteroides abscessus]SLJ01903.1 Universal stress protein family [Mycobacteroides abscessus subsp. massiliense]
MGADIEDGPVVVGVDGSTGARHAAIWAIDEAISRNVPLCLAHVTRIAVTTKSFSEQRRIDDEFAQMSLREAVAAVKATGKPVKIDAVVLRGLAAETLVAESRHSSLICVGSLGIGNFSRALFGSTAAEVAERAHCPVAVPPPPVFIPPQRTQWIALSLSRYGHDDEVIDAAMAEARLRHLPVLAIGTWSEDFGERPYDELDQRVANLRHRYEGVHMYPVVTRGGIARFVADSNEPIALAVIGKAEARQVAKIGSVSAEGERSVLVVRS